jgi:hypothetical protein
MARSWYVRHVRGLRSGTGNRGRILSMSRDTLDPRGPKTK